MKVVVVEKVKEKRRRKSRSDDEDESESDDDDRESHSTRKKSRVHDFFLDEAGDLDVTPAPSLPPLQYSLAAI